MPGSLTKTCPVYNTPFILNWALLISSAGVPETANITTSPALKADNCTPVRRFQSVSYALTAEHIGGRGVGVDVTFGVGVLVAKQLQSVSFGQLWFLQMPAVVQYPVLHWLSAWHEALHAMGVGVGPVVGVDLGVGVGHIQSVSFGQFGFLQTLP